MVERLRAWSKGAPQGPLSVHIDPSNRCNLKCKFCWQRSHERLGWLDTTHELSDEKLVSIVKEAAELGVKEWLISGGGEPLIRTDATVTLMEEIKRLGMHGDIITNGTMPERRHLESIVRCGWDVFRVSINAPDEKTHDYIVGCDGAFRRAVANIRELQRIKSELKSDRPEVGFNTVINRVNYKMIPEIVELLQGLGGTFINVQTIILYSDEEKRWSLDDEHRKDSQKYIERGLALARKFGIRTNLENYLEKDFMEKSTEIGKMRELGMEELGKINSSNEFLKSFCFEPFYLMTIRSNGIVGSCRLFGDKGDDITNKTLKEAWFGEYFSNARRAQTTGNAPDFCSKCGSNEFLENRRIRDELARTVG